MIIAAILLDVFAVYLSIYVLYQLMLFGANAFIRDAPALQPSTTRLFNVIVPAHNEELHLPRLLASFNAQRYAKDRYRVTVVADNCADGTVAACRPFDVDVFERKDDTRRGKGYAIAWAIDRLESRQFDAVVIVDADSQVDASFLGALNVQMERGDKVIQCYNGVANPDQSWFTRLMHVSRTIANDILHPGKRKLGLSSHLMGNGMCFDRSILQTFGWQAFSVGEDWEYYATLVLNGIVIGYSRFARVYHQESVNLRQASSQRLRWSGSRFQVLRQFGPPLLSKGVRAGDLRCVDAAMPLVLPNPSLGMNLTFVGLILSAAYVAVTGRVAMLEWYGVLVSAQLAMFLIGVLYTKNKVASAASLVVAPVFLAWKMGIDLLSLFGLGTKEWKATERRVS